METYDLHEDRIGQRASMSERNAKLSKYETVCFWPVNPKTVLIGDVDWSKFSACAIEHRLYGDY